MNRILRLCLSYVALLVFVAASFVFAPVAQAQYVAATLAAQHHGGGSTFSPVLVSSYASGTDNAYYFDGSGAGPTSPTYTVYPKLPFLGGANCAVLAFEFNSQYTISSVTDNESETWIAGPTVTDANGSEAALYYVLADTAGTNKIQIAFSGTPSTSKPMTMFSPYLHEFENCGATIGGNGTLDTAATGSALTLTLSAAPSSGDMALGYFWDTAAGPGGGTLPFSTLVYDTTVTPESGFTPLSIQRSFGKLSEFSTSTTSTSIQATFSGTRNIIGLGIVIKKGLAGTNPPATKYVDHFQVEQVDVTTPTIDFPMSGNLVVSMWSSGGATMSSLSCSSGTGNAGTFSNNVSVAQVSYCTNVTPSSSFTFTPTFSTTPASSGSMLALASVSNAQTSPFDTQTTGHATSGAGVTTAANVAATSIIPSANGEIIFSVSSLVWHTLKGIVADANGHTGNLLAATTTNGDDANSSCSTATPNSTLDEDNGWFMFQNVSDHTAITPTYSGTQNSGQPCASDPTGVVGIDTANAAFK
jgi:hypothetical protein